MSTTLATSAGNGTITPSGGTLYVVGNLSVTGTTTLTTTSSVMIQPGVFNFTERAHNVARPYMYDADNVSTSASHGKCYFVVAETLSTYYLRITAHRDTDAGILRIDIQDADSSTTIGGSFPYDFDTYSSSGAFNNGMRRLTIAGISLTAGTKYQIVLSTNGQNASSSGYNIYLYNNGITLGENLNGFTTGQTAW